MGPALSRHGPLLLAGYLRPWAERLTSMVRAAPGDIALDLMCDGGAGAEMLARRGASVTAIDADEGVLSAAAAQARRDVVVRPVSDRLPFANGAVDVAVSLFTIGLAPWPPALLADLRRVMAPGGRVAVAVWSSTGSAEAMLREILVARGFRSSFLDALVDPALGDVSWLHEQTVRDVARFDGVEQFWLGMVQGRPLGEELLAFGTPERAALRVECLAALRPHTAADGTLRVPVEARVFTLNVAEAALTGVP